MSEQTTDKISRPSFNEYAVEVCHAVARRATCLHRDQGAIIVVDNRIAATGYNGAPSGLGDCIEIGHCQKKMGNPCRAEGLHGESNAIISAARMGTSIKGGVMYCIYAPCRTCCNMIKNAGISLVYYEQDYPGFPDSKGYLEYLNVVVKKLT